MTKIVLCVFALLIISIYSILLSYDFNKFKASVEEQISNKIGKKLIINGTLALHCFPWFTFEINDIIVKANNKYPDLTIEKVKLSPSVLSLLPGRIVTDIQLLGIKTKAFYIPESKTKLTIKEKELDFRGILVHLNPAIKLDNVRIEITDKAPKFYIKHQDKDFPLAHLLSVLKIENKIEGDTQLKLDISATGNTLHEIKRSISGVIEMEIEEGKIYGVNLIAALRQAKSIFKSIASTIAKPITNTLGHLITKNRHPTETTPFKNLVFHATLENGILKNHTLKVSHSHFGINGAGNINLYKNTLDYQIVVSYHSVPLVIYVTGLITNPSIKPDMKSYLNFTK